MIYHGRTRNSLDGLEWTIAVSIANLFPHQDEFDSIIVIGMSGVIVGVPVSLGLKKPLVIIRKADDRNHCGQRKIINLAKLGARSVFLDDFIALGRTFALAKKRVEENGGKVIASYEYENHWYTKA